GFELAEIVPAVEQWRYRNKLEYSFGTLERSGTGGEREPAGELVCGFHAPAGANAVLGLEDCLLASLDGNRARRAALRWCREAGALADVLREGLGEQLSGVLWTRSRSPAETTAGGETELVWGELQLPERVCELDLRISPEAFFQTNTEMAEVVYGYAQQYAG